MPLTKIHRLFKDVDYDDVDNLHLIAISNVDDTQRRIERWWEKKYRKPLVPYLEHTQEELYVKYLEDYYERNPEEAERFLNSLHNVPEWDGTMDEEHERQMQARWKKKKQIDLTQFQSDKELTEEEEQAILDNLGKNLIKKVVVKNKSVAEEFEESFLGE